MDTSIGFLPPRSVSLRSCAVLCPLSWRVLGASSALAADTCDPASERAVAAARSHGGKALAGLVPAMDQLDLPLRTELNWLPPGTERHFTKAGRDKEYSRRAFVDCRLKLKHRPRCARFKLSVLARSATVLGSNNQTSWS